MNRLEKITTILNSAKRIKSHRPTAHSGIQQKIESGLNVNIANNNNSSISVVLKKTPFFIALFLCFLCCAWLLFFIL